MANVLDSLGTLSLGSMDTILYWLGWSVLSMAIIGAIAGLYFFMDYKYKVIVFERRGSGNDNFYIGKIRTDRAKILKPKANDTSTTPKLQLLFSKKKIDIMPDECIIGKNQLYITKISNDLYIPMKIKIDGDTSNFLPISQQTREWAMNEIKQATMEYQAKNAFEQYGQYFLMAGTILFCLALTGATVYFTFKYAGGGLDAMRGLTGALNNFGNTIGAPPG